MKKILLVITAALSLAWIVSSCGDDDNNWDQYADWRDANDAWYAEQKELKASNGSLFYSLCKPSWYQGSGVLIHYYNDRSLTAGNLIPLSNSTVKVKYRGELYNGTPFDSSYTEVDSTRTFELGPNLIMGWRIALSQMHVGDSVDIIVPWAQAYSYSGSTNIYPYSDLKFSIKLVDIPKYEIK